jgi:hypothetical protein
MALFGLKQKKEDIQQAAAIPVDEVLRMKQQGFTNNQIVQTLQRNGYKMHQIFDAMNQADLRSAGPIDNAVPPEEAQMQFQEQEMQGMPPPEMQGQATREALPNLPEQQQRPAPEQGYEEQIEEVAEAIIDEKWEDLMKDINKLLEWKEKIENKMATLEQGFTDLKENFANLQKGVIGKVAEYDKTMSNVGTDLKAMENVFQKILPTLTDNVNELSRLTKKTKNK